MSRVGRGVSRLERRGMGLAMGASVALPTVLTLRPASHPAAAADAASAPVFAQTTPTCPPGQHWEDDGPAASAVRGLARVIAACVPDAPATAAAPPAPATTVTIPAAPIVCPPEWPLWWLLVAFGAGAAAGAYAKRDMKAARRNGRRIVMNMGTRAASRAFGF